MTVPVGPHALLCALIGATLDNTYGDRRRRQALEQALRLVRADGGTAEAVATHLRSVAKYLSYDERARLDAAILTLHAPSAPAGSANVTNDCAVIREARIATRKPRPARKAQSPSILVIAATQLEYEVAIDLAGVREQLRVRRRNVGQYIAIDLGLENCSTWLLRCKAGAIGPNSSAVRVAHAIGRLHRRPFGVIATGIAFGLQRENQCIGDILVAEQIRLYEIVRKGAKREIHRGDRPSASPVLLDWLHSAAADWALETAHPQRPRIHTGVLMTGEKLVDDRDFVGDLLAMEPEAVGGEMEAAGIYSAALPDHVNWAIVKGICDWGYDKDTSAQAIAARNAFDYVYHALEQPVAKQAIVNSNESNSRRLIKKRR